MIWKSSIIILNNKKVVKSIQSYTNHLADCSWQSAVKKTRKRRLWLCYLRQYIFYNRIWMDLNLKHWNYTGPCDTVQRLFGSVDSKQNHIRTVEHISMQVRQEELQNWVKFFQKDNSDIYVHSSIIKWFPYYLIILSDVGSYLKHVEGRQFVPSR